MTREEFNRYIKEAIEKPECADCQTYCPSDESNKAFLCDDFKIDDEEWAKFSKPTTDEKALLLACIKIHEECRCLDESDCCFGVDCVKCLMDSFRKQANNG